MQKGRLEEVRLTSPEQHDPDAEGGRDYAAKRSFESTPEPPPEAKGDVDPTKAKPGKSFVIHQHHARRLHFDLRLEMFHGKVPVLVSWAVPKNLPRRPGKKVLAVHVEDHPFEYGGFSGAIPPGNYGAGEVRIFDSGEYEMLEQAPAKLTFRLKGRRMKAVFHLIQTKGGEKDQWLAFLKEWEGPEPEPLPASQPMLAGGGREPFDDEEWAFEPRWRGLRSFAFCEGQTVLKSAGGRDVSGDYPGLAKVHERLVALDGVLDGVIVALRKDSPAVFMAFDLLYLDGRSVESESLERRRQLLEAAIVPSPYLDVTPQVSGAGTALFEASSQQGLPGILGKKRSSKYVRGRSADWVEMLAP